MQSIVELRNYTGIMLIDRNDELCLLYERHAVQARVLQTGDGALARLSDQARVLTLEVSELQRSVAAAKKQLPRIPALDGDVVALQQELLLTRRKAAALEARVEEPGAVDGAHAATGGGALVPAAPRWRLLPGRIPDHDEVRVKLSALEERLNTKREQLLERDLILEEVCLFCWL